MKLYSSIGPNPKIVRVFAAEKGIALDIVAVDILAGENLTPDFRAINPSGQVPVLDAGADGIIAETVAICEYLEDIHPSPSLIGQTAAERAETRMWMRRVDLNICEPMGNGFRYAEGLAMFKDRMPCIPEAAEGLKAQAGHHLRWLNTQMNGRDYLCGDRFTLADIMLHTALRFFGRKGQPLDPALTALHGWVERVNTRPSTKA